MHFSTHVYAVIHTDVALPTTAAAGLQPQISVTEFANVMLKMTVAESNLDVKPITQ